MKDFNILISSAGRRVSLIDTFRSALDLLELRGQVCVADMSRTAPAFHRADRAALVPRCTAPEFVSRVLEICVADNIGLVIPTIDTELAVYAQNFAKFEDAGVSVAVSSLDTISIASDKWNTHRWLSTNGFPTVAQATVEEVLAADSNWTFPLFAKPTRGSRSIGAAVVHDHTALEALAGDEDYVVQTIAPGEEYTVSVFVDRSGRCRCSVPRKRLEVRAGEVSKGMTVRNESIEQLAMQVAEKLPGAFGALNVQIFHDPQTSSLNVIEINPRFGGGYPLAWHAGARYSQWLIEEVLARPSTASSDEWRDRFVMLRYDQAVYLSAEEAGL